jgi:hypothetical protein
MNNHTLFCKMMFNRPVIRSSLVLGILVLMLASLAHSQSDSFELPNFPYYRQETEWNCGPAALQMVYKYMTGMCAAFNSL